jgi:hypothetical protein
MPKNSQDEACPQYLRIVEMLRARHYFQSWIVPSKHVAENFHLEAWTGARGVVILQCWDKGNGVTVYTTEGIPSKWDDFHAWLTK